MRQVELVSCAGRHEEEGEIPHRQLDIVLGVAVVVHQVEEAVIDCQRGNQRPGLAQSRERLASPGDAEVKRTGNALLMSVYSLRTTLGTSML